MPTPHGVPDGFIWDPHRTRTWPTVPRCTRILQGAPAEDLLGGLPKEHWVQTHPQAGRRRPAGRQKELTLDTHTVSGSPHERLPRLLPSELDDAQALLYQDIVKGSRGRASGGRSLMLEDGSLRGPFNAMLFNPQLGNALQNVGVAIRYGTTLSGRVRELAILATAAANDCRYEWSAHVLLAEKEGFDPDQIAAIAERGPVPGLSAEESLAYELVTHLVGLQEIDDATLGRALSGLGTVGTVELVFLVGYYELLARSLTVWRIYDGDEEREAHGRIIASHTGRP